MAIDPKAVIENLAKSKVKRGRYSFFISVEAAEAFKKICDDRGVGISAAVEALMEQTVESFKKKR